MNFSGGTPSYRTWKKNYHLVFQNVGICFKVYYMNLGLLTPLNAELNPILQLLTLFGAHHILYVSRISVVTEFHKINTQT
jgi:hypothetical protein